jgi:predicted deacetylase
MRNWLDPVRASLESRRSPVSVFVRDDDAGWGTGRLHALLDLTQRHGVPIDVAAIPAAIDAQLSCDLRRIVDRSDGSVSVHQHGYAHINHEPAGRKCEFGASRSSAAQRDDISLGRRVLQDRLGMDLPPIFTPPWNRCSDVTVAILAELGFKVLSRDVATPCAHHGIAELPVHLDWTGRRGIRRGTAAWGESIAQCLASAVGPVGLMLHHAEMSTEDLTWLGELLAVMAAHQSVHTHSMSQACGLSSHIVGFAQP